MTTTIAVLSGKGGVTKSTIARAVGTAYSVATWKVLGADMDIGQATMANWMRKRMANKLEPIFDVQSFGTPAQVKKSIDGDVWDLCVIDCPAFASKDTIQYAQMADLVVIPTRFSLDDMESTVKTANSLVKEGIPSDKLAIAFSGVAESQNEYDQARDYMGKTIFYVIPGYIPHKPALSAAQDVGKSILECQYVGPRDKADKVIQGIMNRLAEITA